MALVFFGDPVIDIMIECGTSCLKSHGIPASSIGGSELVSRQELDRLRKAACSEAGLQHGGLRRTGGSAANMARCVSRLRTATAALSQQDAAAVPVRFVGMVGDDAEADEFETALKNDGVEPMLIRSTSGASTATCLCLVTAGGQRTMRTCLGAADELQHMNQLPRGWDDGPMAWLHCEGYSLHRADVATAVIQAANKAGARVSLDLASFEVVRYCWPALENLLQQRLLHVVFANEEEAAAVSDEASSVTQSALGSSIGDAQLSSSSSTTPPKDTSMNSTDCLTTPGLTRGNVSSSTASPQEQLLLDDASVAAAQLWLLQSCAVAVVSLGSRGCVTRSAAGDAAACSADKVAVTDTVGAGDGFAAGWLTAFLAGAPLAACAKAGCSAGTAAVQTVGGVLSNDVIGQLACNIAALLRP